MYSDLRKIREERGLTVEQLSEQSGVSVEKIREIESGIYPEMDEFLQLADEQDMEPIELYKIYCIGKKLDAIRKTRRWRLKG